MSERGGPSVSDAKRDTAKSEAAAPGDLEADILTYSATEIRNSDGTGGVILTPDFPGLSEEERSEAGRRFALWLQALPKLGLPAYDPTPEVVETRLDAIAVQAGASAGRMLYDLGVERFGKDAFAEALYRDDPPDGFLNNAYEKFTDYFRASLRQGDPLRHIQRVEDMTRVSLIAELEGLRGDSQGFLDAYKERYTPHLLGAIRLMGKHLARSYLEELKPDEATLEELVALIYQPTGQLEGVARAAIAGTIYSPTDRAFEALVQYMGGRMEPREYRDGFAVLPDIRRGPLQVNLQVRESPERLAEVLTPESVEPVLAKIQAERNETKAKTLVAAFALASDPNSNPEAFRVRLHDLVELVSGYRRSGPKKTQSRMYWRKLAEILRYLQFDLSNTQVNIRVIRQSGKGRKQQEEVKGEYLMRRPRLIAEQPFAYPEIYGHLGALIAEGEGRKGSDEEQLAIKHLQHLKPTEVELGFPVSIMRSFGYEKRAIEIANREVLALTGPTFWLAYEITFRRRWTNPKNLEPGGGVPLLEVLESHGFLEKSVKRTGGRPSYTHALREFFSSVKVLLDLGELDDPGVRIWKMHGGRAQDRRSTLEEWVQARGKRITEQDLEPLKVEYVYQRRRALEEARRKAIARTAKRARAKGSEG